MNLKNVFVHFRLLVVLLLASALVFGDENQPTSQSKSEIEISPPSTPEEARSRAKLLHEMVRGALQIMHRDFFDEENAHAIPSASLEDVFHEMGKSYDVQMKWLTVNTDLVNVDHQAKSAFEKAAVKELAAGKQMAEKSRNAATNMPERFAWDRNALNATYSAAQAMKTEQQES
jgi:hypothetical protein